jgi:hypothetical protein
MAIRPQYSREVIGLSTGQMSDNEMLKPALALPRLCRSYSAGCAGTAW